MHVSKLERIKLLCEMSRCVGVSSEGKSGGLAMLWKEEVDLNLRSLSKHHIDIEVVSGIGNQQWRITRIYGELATQNRANTWNLLRTLSAQSDEPWLCLDDFNEI
ncbi:hypothetical protein PTKIN_Ptkin02bG0073400 [Pterospermum kingtungense]